MIIENRYLDYLSNAYFCVSYADNVTLSAVIHMPLYFFSDLRKAGLSKMTHNDEQILKHNFGNNNYPEYFYLNERENLGPLVRVSFNISPMDLIPKDKSNIFEVETSFVPYTISRTITRNMIATIENEAILNSLSETYTRKPYVIGDEDSYMDKYSDNSKPIYGKIYHTSSSSHIRQAISIDSDFIESSFFQTQKENNNIVIPLMYFNSICKQLIDSIYIHSTQPPNGLSKHQKSMLFLGYSLSPKVGFIIDKNVIVDKNYLNRKKIRKCYRRKI